MEIDLRLIPTLPDHIAIPDQVIIDLLMLSRMEGYKLAIDSQQPVIEKS